MPASIRLHWRELEALDQAHEHTGVCRGDLRALYLVLRERMDFASGRVGLVTRVTRKRIAEALDWSEGKVRYVLAALVAAGLVAIESVARRFMVHLVLAERDAPEAPSGHDPPPRRRRRARGADGRQRELRLLGSVEGKGPPPADAPADPPAEAPEAPPEAPAAAAPRGGGRSRIAAESGSLETPTKPGSEAMSHDPDNRIRSRYSGSPGSTPLPPSLRPASEVAAETLATWAERWPELAARKRARGGGAG